MSAKSAKLIRRAIKENKEWLIRWLLASESRFEKLRKDLAEGNLPGMRCATISLGILCCHYAREGTNRVMDGDVAGWEEIHKAIAYEFWNLKIMFEAFRAEFPESFDWRGDLRGDFTITALLFCYYATSGDAAGQRYTIDLLKVLARVAEVGDEYFWESRTFELFVLRLGQKQEKLLLRDAIQRRDLGPYAKVLEHWDAPDRLGDAIYDLCEYHCDNMYSRGNDWTSVFVHNPFDLLPCEIQAIYAIRRKLGLETPRVEHPLLATPLADFQLEPQFRGDDLLARVGEAFTAVFGREGTDSVDADRIIGRIPDKQPEAQSESAKKPPRHGGKPFTIRRVKHLNPFSFKNVDFFSIVGTPLAEIETTIPFLEEAVEVTEVLVDPNNYPGIDKYVFDEVHVFTPPGGTDGMLTERQFEFYRGVLRSSTTGIDRNYIDRLVEKVTRK